jgi:hypothetical protein
MKMETQLLDLAPVISGVAGVLFSGPMANLEFQQLL